MTTRRKPGSEAVVLRRRAKAELRSLRVWRKRRPMMAELHRRARVEWRAAQAKGKFRKGPGRRGGVSGETGVRGREAGGGKDGMLEAVGLVHELQVHQVELELQNAELQETRDRLQELLAHYTDLYDSAPVGYLTLAADGTIRQINVAGARQLGMERGRLIGRRLGSHVAPPGRPGFGVFLHHLFRGRSRRSCEVPLLGEGSEIRIARIESDGVVRGAECRVVMVDVTERWRAEAAQRRVLALSASNRKLEREVARRLAAERGLKRSEQDLGRMLASSCWMQGRLRELSRRVLRVQEEERKRISRELHDVVAQGLAAVNVQLAALGPDPSADSGVMAAGIARTRRLVEQAVQTVHQFARELRPTVLDDLGLVPALRSFLRAFVDRTGLMVRVTAFSGGDSLDGDTRTALFRVAQEALNNVARHARASRVTVTLRRGRGEICMRVRDNGCSFRVDRVQRARGGKHLGLLGMRERLEMVGGRFDIVSRPGAGTLIMASVPRGANSPAKSGARLRGGVSRGRRGGPVRRPASPFPTPPSP